MFRCRNLSLSPTLAALALAAACATADPPPGEGDGNRFADGDIDTVPPTPDGGGGVGTDGGSDSACPTDPCDLHEQCGCPEGDACDLEFLSFEENEFSDQLACRGVLAPGDELSTCASPSDCAAGYQCISGHCRKYCQNDDDCGGPGGECVFTRAGSERADDSLCSKSCAPDFEADHAASCPSTFSCYIRFVGPEDDRRPITDCLSTGTVGLNEDCSENRCGEGLTCIVFTDSEGNSESRCQRRCRVDDQTCPDGSPCAGFDDPTLVGTVEYGFCRSE